MTRLPQLPTDRTYVTAGDVIYLPPTFHNTREYHYFRSLGGWHHGLGKTAGSDAPIVSWKLWPETQFELDAWEGFAPASSELYLARVNGKPWVVEGLNEKERRSRDDAFRRELWLPFAEAHDLRLSSDAIRASCANLLKTDSDRTNQLSIQIKYLGQTPSGVAPRHYIDPDQGELDSAIIGLRTKLFGK